jgi:pimeloyl-ACP methyl ester carboxylesterase
MRVEVNGVRLFFDVEGARFVPDGPVMRQKPTLLLLHGGPGMDHSWFKPRFSAFSDICQVVYLDHRGNGRSDAGPVDRWNLAQWGDDVKAFCDALEVEHPIVVGVSFGGFVAQSYATRYPGHPAKLILVSTAAREHGTEEWHVNMYEQLGGREAAEVARRRFTEGLTPDTMADWLRVCAPLQNRTSNDPAAMKRVVRNGAVQVAFESEAMTFDFRQELSHLRCPTLLLAGELDPLATIECSEEIVAALPPGLVQVERFKNCGHNVFRDAPESLDVLREFILS